MKLGTSSILIVAILCLFACSKNNYETVPKITLKSIGPAVVKSLDRFSIEIEFEDKEGDVTDSIIIIRHTHNQRLESNPLNTMTIRNNIPQYPFAKKGQLSAVFKYNQAGVAWEGSIPGAEVENDTCTFTIYVRDAAGNYSNRLESEQIIFLLPPK